ncbi:MAG TPA: hypothetical protein VHK01_07330 [Lacipirellulaceae bacterium]|jgi:hypothetical protein|nr:hypothetical protein [Lacipirellulaceae bacterium]
MNVGVGFRGFVGLLHLAAMVVAMTTMSSAAPTFISQDPRLPNPDRPYVMRERAVYGPVVAIDDLTISVANPAQLDTPSLNSQGDWAFDSTFDVNYSAILIIGLAPPRFVTGMGSARAMGVAPGDGPILASLVYDTELLALDLSDPPGFRFRESPTLQSTGVTTVEDPCPVCGAPFIGFVISSYFDVFSEVSIDGGATWNPAASSFRIEQIPEPGTLSLASICCIGVWWSALSRKRPGGPRH